MALLAAAYVLIGYHLLHVGDLATSEAPAGIIYVAAGCYALGGLLILLRWRWLWIFGALMNALVILMSNWLPEAVEFVRANRVLLARVP